MTSCSVRGRDGFLWFGTNVGLVKYDGYTYRKFGAGPDTLPGSYVSAIYADRGGWIWIGTPDGIRAAESPRAR